MKAGKLRNLITIQTPTETFDTEGELLQSWTDYVSIWAEIIPLIGREYWSARQVNAEITGKLRIRYFSGITPKMRIKFGSRYFNILGIINVEERNEEMIIYYSEAV